MKWERVRLGDVCSKIGSGATPKGGATIYIDDGISLIRSQNVYNLEFSYDGLAHITEDAAKKLNGVIVQSDDVLLNITGDSVARTCIAPDDVLPARVNQHVAIVRPNSNALNPQFLNYFLASPYMQSYMLGLAVGKGASRNAMTKDMIANFNVPCPPIDVQESIVNTLSAYDNLIENNQKQIKLLEEAAQRLYKEWFIDLRFPGHETTQIVDGVPEGWSVSTVGDVCELRKNTVSPKTIGETVPYIGLEHIPRKDICLSVWGDSKDVSSNKYRFIKHDIIFGKIRPYFHKVGFALTDGIASTDSFILNPHKEIWGLFLLTVSSEKFVSYSYQTCKEGAKMPRADWNQMQKYPLLIAQRNIQDKFEKIVNQLTERIEVLALQNRELKNARDCLLPKLMNGEIEV